MAAYLTLKLDHQPTLADYQRVWEACRRYRLPDSATVLTHVLLDGEWVIAVSLDDPVRYIRLPSQRVPDRVTPMRPARRARL